MEATPRKVTSYPMLAPRTKPVSAGSPISQKLSLFSNKLSRSLTALAAMPQSYDREWINIRKLSEFANLPLFRPLAFLRLAFLSPLMLYNLCPFLFRIRFPMLLSRSFEQLVQDRLLIATVSQCLCSLFGGGGSIRISHSGIQPPTVPLVLGGHIRAVLLLLFLSDLLLAFIRRRDSHTDINGTLKTRTWIDKYTCQLSVSSHGEPLVER